MFGVFGGMFIVPLESLIQLYSNKNSLGRVLAGKNFIANIGMLIFLGIPIGCSLVNISSGAIFYILAGIVIVGAGYILILMKFNE